MTQPQLTRHELRGLVVLIVVLVAVTFALYTYNRHDGAAPGHQLQSDSTELEISAPPAAADSADGGYWHARYRSDQRRRREISEIDSLKEVMERRYYKEAVEAGLAPDTALTVARSRAKEFRRVYSKRLRRRAAVVSAVATAAEGTAQRDSAGARLRSPLADGVGQR